MDFDEIYIGQEAVMRRCIKQADLEAFAQLSGDRNPLHMDADYARRTSFQRPVVHGMLVANYVSTLIGMHLPGPGALWNRQTINWLVPVFVGDDLEIRLAVLHKSDSTRSLTVTVSATNQHGVKVMDGEGVVMMLEQSEHKKDRPLADRVAVVTGSSRGIGAAIATKLAKSGAAVMVNYLNNREAAESLAESLKKHGSQVATTQADVTDADAANELVRKAADRFGQPVDVLVNNASGPFESVPFSEMAWSQMNNHLESQIRGAFNCCQAVIGGMVSRQSGRIVNIGSTIAWGSPPPNFTGYVTAKAALHAFTRCLAVELGPKGVCVNMVSPGMTETDLIAEVPERLRKVNAMRTPLRRLANVENIADAVVFLCSNAGEFITGADLPVCGGAAM